MHKQSIFPESSVVEMTCLIKTKSDILSFVLKTEHIYEYVSHLEDEQS